MPPWMEWELDHLRLANPATGHPKEQLGHSGIVSGGILPPHILIHLAPGQYPVAIKSAPLIAHSAWFRTAWERFGRYMFRFPLLTTANMQIFREFIYTGKYTLPQLDFRPTGPKEVVRLLEEYPASNPNVMSRHIRIYTMATRFKIAELAELAFRNIFNIAQYDRFRLLLPRSSSPDSWLALVRFRLEMIRHVYSVLEGIFEPLKRLLLVKAIEEWPIYVRTLEEGHTANIPGFFEEVEGLFATGCPVIDENLDIGEYFAFICQERENWKDGGQEPAKDCGLLGEQKQARAILRLSGTGRSPKIGKRCPAPKAIWGKGRGRGRARGLVRGRRPAWGVS